MTHELLMPLDGDFRFIIKWLEFTVHDFIQFTRWVNTDQRLELGNVVRAFADFLFDSIHDDMNFVADNRMTFVPRFCAHVLFFHETPLQITD
jgi:hypothetical protein